MKPRLGFLIVGHRDYQNDIAEEMAAKGVENIRRKGIDVVLDPKSYTDTVEAQNAAKRLSKADIDGVIIFLGTWIESSTAMAAVRMVEHLPFLVWGFPMFLNKEGRRDQTGSLVSYAVFKGALDRVGYNYKGVLGSVEDDKKIDEITCFAKAANTYQRLKETRIGLFGYTSMTMYPGTFDHLILRTCIGPEVVHFDTYSIIEGIKKVPDRKLAEEVNKLKSKVKIASNVTGKMLNTAVGMYLSIMDIVKKNKLNSINVKCQYELSQDFGMTACVPISLAADSGVVSGCEGDTITTVSMIILNYLTDQVIYYGDIIDIKDSRIWISSCGMAPYSLADPSREMVVNNFSTLFEHLKKTEKDKSKGMDTESFKGLINSFTLKPGRVTYMRLVEDIGSYHLVYGTGTGLPTELRQGVMPGIEIEIDGDVKKLVDMFPSQHYALCYGDITNELLDLCKILDINAVKI